jgi:hypothetical protein
LKKKQWIAGLAVLAAFVALVAYTQHKYQITWQIVLEKWHEFLQQFQKADWRKIAFSLAIIYCCYLIRSMRWARLLQHIKQVGPFSLLGTQAIGFTCVALLGRIADPVRPYLVAKKTGLPLSNQVAVYIVERLLDAGAMALIFFTVILIAPAGAMPHPEVVRKVAKGGLITTLAGGVFLLAVRMAGERVAAFSERLFGKLSAKLGHVVGHKIRAFRTGLDTMRSLYDFGAAASLSLLMWGLIVLAYVEIIQAFVPELTLAQCMMLMAWGMLASIFQLPVVGWFTQIGFVAAAMTGFFMVIPATAMACAATLLVVTFLGIVPVGLIWAQVEHVNLRKIAAESEHAEEALAVEGPGD